MDRDVLDKIPQNKQSSLNFSLPFILVLQPGILLRLGLDEYFMPCVPASRLFPAPPLLPEVIWDQVEQDSHILTWSK